MSCQYLTQEYKKEKFIGDSLSFRHGYCPITRRAHQDDSNITMKGYTTIPKEVAHAIKATTQKDNKKTIIMKCASHTYI
jgi:transcriptional regulator with PAS, ATPase and Fis domain